MRSSVGPGFGVGILGLCLTLAASGTCLAQQQCIGDCNGDGIVTINEIITAVNVDLGDSPVGVCPALDCNTRLGIYIDCVIVAVNNALRGCPVGTPQPSATPIQNPTPATITYQLTQGSMISFSPSVGDLPDVGPAPLSGTFTVVRSDGAPNTFFAFSIVGIDFRAGASFTVTGNLMGQTLRYGCLDYGVAATAQVDIGLGCIDALTFEPPTRTDMSARVSINGEDDVRLFGHGPFDGENNPPILNDLELCEVSIDHPACDGPYHLTLFAVPENGVSRQLWPLHRVVLSADHIGIDRLRPGFQVWTDTRCGNEDICR